MGINLEFVATLAEIRCLLPSHPSVIELGAQDICADPGASASLLAGYGFPNRGPIRTSAELFERAGFRSYEAIDLNENREGVHRFNLNENLVSTYGFTRTFDLVTNLGTLEHCFDQASGFRNMHNLTKVGGYMLHCLPSQGLVNHAFYNYHPRIISELAIANSYETHQIFFTADFTPKRVSYSIENFQTLDTRDILVYAILKRTKTDAFNYPSDRMFTNQPEVMASDFRPYVKAPWSNIKSQT
jgi:Methyltransferase domain